MSFQDDLIEPDAIESAAHFSGLVRPAAPPNDRDEPEQQAPRERIDLRRALPRELGN